MPNLAEILKGLSPEQKGACQEPGNILLTACPGSGKTRTLTRRLAYQAFQKPSSQKLNVAITYTNRAAEEITYRLDRMAVDLANIWTGTIHQFCMRFIIRPYAMYSDRLSKGYTIIDEFVKSEYGNRFAKELGINLKPYDDPFKCPSVVNKYEQVLKENREIDFDMILRFSDDLLTGCPFICENIAPTINSILVDEFQDTNELQYTILAKIYKKNKSISIMFVGDTNQAIYGSLGGIAKCKAELDILFETSFKEMALTGCYRSTQRLVNLYRNFGVSNVCTYSVAEIKNDAGIISYNKSISIEYLAPAIANIIRHELESGRKPEEVCVLAPQWYMLLNLSRDLRLQLPDVSFDAPDISPIKYDPLNPLFLLAKLLFMPSGEKVPLRKRIANDFIAFIRDDLKVNIPDTILNYDILSAVNQCRKIDDDGIVCLKEATNIVFHLLKIDISEETMLLSLKNRFFAKIDARVRKYSLPTDYNSICKYFRENEGVVISTIHGVKGEEYTTVIATGLLNGYLPNWDYIFNPEKQSFRRAETLKLLYVLCSRAKKNLYLFSETGRKTKGGTEYTPTDELSLIAHIGTL